MNVLSKPVLPLLMLLGACWGPSNTGDGPTPEERQIQSVSGTPLTATLEPPEMGVRMLNQLPRVDTPGQCAPRYRHGGAGSCVNDQPCRGFGVRASDGRILCSCYGDIGGCAEDQRCDEKKLICVPDEVAPFERAP